MNCTKDACQKEDANARMMLLEILLSAESATLFLFFHEDAQSATLIPFLFHEEAGL